MQPEEGRLTRRVDDSSLEDVRISGLGRKIVYARHGLV
jgi:hypothetical protein